MFIDANEIENDVQLEADICIVGAGAAGITLAKELAGSSQRVIILEAGGFEHDEQRERDLYELDVIGAPIRDDLPTRRMQFGGSTKAWFGRIGKLDPIDFTHRDWVPHSGWPIDQDTIAPYLGRAAATLGVPLHDKLNPTAWQDDATAKAFRSSDLDTGVFLWANHADMAEHYRALLENTDNLHVVLNAYVQSLESSMGEHVTHAEVLSISGKTCSVYAKKFVLACGGHENARLLLLSNNQAINGLGNQHDNVGRYLVDHPRSEGVAHIELADDSPETLAKVAMLGEKAASPYGPVQMYIKFSEDRQRKERLLNHCVHAHLIRAGQELEGWNALRQLITRNVSAGSRSLSEIGKAIGKDIPGLLRYGPALLRGKAPLKFVALLDQMEQEPNRTSRVRLSDTRRDHFGNPLLAVDWWVNTATQRSRVRMHELIAERITSQRIGSLISPALHDEPQPQFLDMKHPAGTTRMSADPIDGVVDADCRVHGMSNLFITGSSVFPTSGHANPTFTIVALATRLADQLKQEESVAAFESAVSAE